jgi:integrase
VANVIFKIRSTKQSEASVYLRLRINRQQDYKVRLPIRVNRNQWVASAQQLKTIKGNNQNEVINTKLAKLKSDLLYHYNHQILNNQPVDLNWLKATLNSLLTMSSVVGLECATNFSKYVEYYISKEKPSDRKISMLRNKVPSSVNIAHIDNSWLAQFCEDMVSQGYSENYVGKQVQLIRRVVKHASHHGIAIKHEIFDFKKPSRPTLDVYLNEAEIQRLFDHNCSSERLNNVRKLFLVGCTTGLRISDLMQIHNHLVDDNFLQISQIVKTKQPLIIPLDPRVKKFIPELRPISAPKFNLYIKELCKEVGITQKVKGYVRNKQNKYVHGYYPKYLLIRSHTMRRSFASNLYGKVPTVVIMAITGHTTEQSFLTYIKKPQREFAEQLGAYYQNKEY